MSLIPDTATFHKYLTISNGQIGFTPEARTSPFADHFYPPGWNIVPNRGVVSYNPLTVATWLMGTMPGMEGVSRNEYMLVDDTEDSVVGVSSQSNGSFEETGVPTVTAAVIGETESKNEDASMEDTEHIKDTVVAKDTVQSGGTVDPPSNGSFKKTGAVLPTKDASVIEQAVPMNSAKFVEENIVMEDTVPYEDTGSPSEYEPFEDTDHILPTMSAIDETETVEETMPSENPLSSLSNGSFDDPEPANDTVSRNGDVTKNLETIEDIELTYDGEHLEETVVDAAVPTMPAKDTVKDNVLKEDTLSKRVNVSIEDTELMEITVNEDPVPTMPAVDVHDTVSSPESQNTVPTTSLESRKRKICSICSSTEQTGFSKGLCKNCYQYQKRTNKPRPLTLINQNGDGNSCSNCSSTEQTGFTKGLCKKCYQYRKRTNRPRPPTVITKNGDGNSCSICSSTEQIGFTKGLCKNCYQYQKRTNKPRPLTLINEHGKEKTCSNCSSTKQAGFCKGLCATCYMYQYRHNEARPDAKRVKHGSNNLLNL